MMTLDLASLFAGTAPASVVEKLGSISLDTEPPPAVDMSGHMAHVGTYIQVYYFPLDDALQWIEANHASYRLNHAIALIVACAGPRVETGALVERVKMIYQ